MLLSRSSALARCREEIQMTKFPIAAACASILIAATGGLGAPGDAQAAVYRGIFDPEDANYRWSGTHEFVVADACLESDGWQVANDGYACEVTLVAGSLTVTNKQGTPGVGDDYTETIDFTDFGFIPNSVDIFGLYVLEGELAGVDSFWIGPFVFANGAQLGGNWYLQWESGFAPDFEEAGAVLSKPPGDPVYLYRCPDPLASCVEATPGLFAVPTFVRQTVPEPGSLGLAAGALAGLWWARRRRSVV
jgi:hypothetical protein